LFLLEKRTPFRRHAPGVVSDAWGAKMVKHGIKQQIPKLENKAPKKGQHEQTRHRHLDFAGRQRNYLSFHVMLSACGMLVGVCRNAIKETVRPCFHEPWPQPGFKLVRITPAGAVAVFVNAVGVLASSCTMGASNPKP
jgi:hypothetical protein